MSIPTARPRRVIARTLLFGISALLAAGLLTWNPAAMTGWNQGSAEATLWQLLNGARTNNGLAPLQQNGTLVSLARWRSSDMLNRDYFSHTILGCGCLVYVHYDSNGLQYDWAGENIGWNAGLEDSYSPVRVHERFMASPGHRVNVLDSRFTHGGVGAAAAENKMFQGYVQNTRMYTELFLQAKRAAAPAPPPPAPAPVAPAAPASGGGGGGGGGAAAQPAAPAATAAPKATPKPKPTRKPKAMNVEAPRRPTSTAGIDGVSAIVIERSTVNAAAARLAADDALGAPRPTLTADAPAAAHTAAAPRLEVIAPPPAPAGLFDGIVGTILGLLFG
ncbi:MAG: CAP domain-containing protein [Chloroflexota bacterium]|nr:CAP domain-containing protein [Chloroflexota bacterium]